jgi:signal transduction histidine kinase
VNKLKLSPHRLDLTDVLGSVETATQPIVDAAGQTLTVTLPPEPIFVCGDETRLKQVITNILQNAIKYNTPPGRIWLTLASEAGDAVVKIKDTGIGISNTMLERIFDMFQQARPGISRSQSGLGIGLSVAKRLVDLHHGTISARSNGPGKGSEFEVRLPILMPATEADLRSEG